MLPRPPSSCSRTVRKVTVCRRLQSSSLTCGRLRLNRPLAVLVAVVLTLLLPMGAVVVAAATAATSWPPVDVSSPSGQLFGFQQKVLDTQVDTFLGVPFAEPPIHDRRFLPPLAKQQWKGRLNATRLPAACYQERDGTFGAFKGSNMWNANTPLSEDCLYLNMWVPAGAESRRRTTAGGLLPVVVWLYGGGYWYGSASLALYDGAVLAATGDVIVVNLNYRVGPFGFLYLGTDDVPGNMGLLDQQMGLLWIKENIRAFGGDPSKVALFGESAGASSIVAHMLNTVSNQLFTNGILESGALDNRWSMDTPANARRKSLQCAAGAGCTQTSDLRLLARCLRDVDAKTLSENIWAVTVEPMEFPLVLVSKDANFFHIDAFDALRNGYYAKNINIMVGINHDEGNFWNIYFMPKAFPWNTSLPAMSSKEFERSIDSIYFKQHPLVVRQGAKFTYWDRDCRHQHETTAGDSKNQNASGAKGPPGQMNYYAGQVNQLVGDYFFTCDALWFAEQMNEREYGKVFVYYFDQFSSTNPWPKWTGVMHAYEIEFVFGLPLIDPAYSAAERRLSRMVIDYWTTFMETGHPRLKTAARPREGADDWQPYVAGSAVDNKWFYLKANEVGRIKPKKTSECAFWRSAKDEEYRARDTGDWSVVNSASGVSYRFVFTILYPLWRSLRYV